MSQLTQIIRHIAELLQYDRVRKLANVRIACTLECDFYAATKRKAEANGGDFSVSFVFAIVPIDA